MERYKWKRVFSIFLIMSLLFTAPAHAQISNATVKTYDVKGSGCQQVSDAIFGKGGIGETDSQGKKWAGNTSLGYGWRYSTQEAPP